MDQNVKYCELNLKLIMITTLELGWKEEEDKMEKYDPRKTNMSE